MNEDEVMAKYPILNDMPGNQTQYDFPSVPTHSPLKTPRSPTMPTSSSMPMPMPSSPAMAMPEPMPAPAPTPITKDGIRIPPPTGYDFPPSVVVDARQLASWLAKQHESDYNILILDVRPRDVSDRGCIKHKWSIQIEPLILKEK